MNRGRINKRNRARFHNPDVSILSMNCIGGVLAHDLGIRFNSPTINLYMRAADFIRFCENLDYYLTIDEMTLCTDAETVGDRTYPVARLGDLVLFLVHYPSVEEANRKWQERKTRIHRDNLVILATDRDGMTEELKERFEKLPYRKVLFTKQPDPKHPDCVYIEGYEQDETLGLITDPVGYSGKRVIDQFDWVVFLNRQGNGPQPV
ncbi:MAG: DUF1919 domain-containing protein [Clostridia bacterium]|nr:DUF1919 domain-containing protein [Clostridia bacterium]